MEFLMALLFCIGFPIVLWNVLDFLFGERE